MFRAHCVTLVLPALLMLGLPAVSLAKDTAEGTGTEGAPPLSMIDATDATPPTGIIRTRADLERHLRDTPPAQSPLSHMSSTGRQAFLDDLRFGRTGVAGYSTSVLITELSAPQIEAVLALFGMRAPDSVLENAVSTPADLRARDNAIEAGNACTGTAPCSDIARGYRQFAADHDRVMDDEDLTYTKRVAAIENAYLTWIAPHAEADHLAGTPAPDLELLFRATQATCFHSKQPGCVATLARLLDALDSHDVAATRHYDGVYSQYIAMRDFDSARALRAAHPMPKHEPLPDLHEAGPFPADLPTAWFIDPERRRLERRPVVFDPDIQVVVVAHPNCHWSNNAMLAIEVDPELSAAMRSAIWVMPQGGTLDFDRLQAWNRAHPSATMILSHHTGEWEGVDFSATPIFHVMTRGKVTETVVGWPEEGHRDELLRAIEASGPIAPD